MDPPGLNGDRRLGGLTVNQGSPCEWVFSPPFHTFDANGGTETFGDRDWRLHVDSNERAGHHPHGRASNCGNGLIQFSTQQRSSTAAR
jgi:hypothetical protein